VLRCARIYEVVGQVEAVEREINQRLKLLLEHAVARLEPFQVKHQDLRGLVELHALVSTNMFLTVAAVPSIISL
jgi:hypothetical protein